MDPQEQKIWQLGKAQGKDDAFIKNAILQYRASKSAVGVNATPSGSGGDLLAKAANVVTNIFPGKQVGEAIGTLGGYGLTAVKEKLGFAPKGSTAAYDLSAPTVPQILGDVGRGAAMVGGLKASVPTSFLGNVGQYAGLSAAEQAGRNLSEQKTSRQDQENIVKSAVVGGITGGVFNLLGRATSYLAKKVGAPVLSFTSGVPKKAIEETAKNPEIAKQGLGMSVNEIRQGGVQSLRSLQNDLGNEFASGLDEVVKQSGQTKGGVVYNQTGFLKSAPKIQKNLTEYARNFAREFRLSTAQSPEGVMIGFDKSPIVKAGERANVQEAFRTISNWGDFSAKGMQDLAERMGALRNFESGAKTESSVILSKIYNKIAGTGNTKGLIPEFYPQLAKLRTNFAQNKKVLDEISNVFGAEATKPTQVQAAVSRLDNLFRENRDVYMNAIEQLSQRSGVNYKALLAGGEFQKILPNYVRGIGGGAAVGAGVNFISPWAVVLAPLFSPRFAGLVTRNAPRVGKTAAPIFRSAATQTIPQSQ